MCCLCSSVYLPGVLADEISMSFVLGSCDCCLLFGCLKIRFSLLPIFDLLAFDCQLFLPCQVSYLLNGPLQDYISQEPSPTLAPAFKTCTFCWFMYGLDALYSSQFSAL